MRVTFGEFKLASRDGAVRRSGLVGAQTRPTPFPTLNAAVRRFHRNRSADPLGDLEHTLNQSTYWGAGGSAQARGWARNVVEYFASYVRLAALDGRPVMPSSVSTDVAIGANVIGVTIDVVVLDPQGYVGRLLLWDRPIPNRAEAAMLAAPFAAALEAEGGAGRTVGVEVWHLQSETQIFVSAADALAQLPSVERIVNRFVA